MWQEGKIRAQLHKMLNGTKDVIYEEASASEEGFKAVSLLAFTFAITMFVTGKILLLVKEDVKVQLLFNNNMIIVQLGSTFFSSVWM